MKLLDGEGTLQRVAHALGEQDTLKNAARTTLASALAEGAGAATTSGRSTGRKPVLIVAGGAAGLTAASAAVSAMRRRAGAA